MTKYSSEFPINKSQLAGMDDRAVAIALRTLRQGCAPKCVDCGATKCCDWHENEDGSRLCLDCVDARQSDTF